MLVKGTLMKGVTNTTVIELSDNRKQLENTEMWC